MLLGTCNDSTVGAIFLQCGLRSPPRRSCPCGHCCCYRCCNCCRYCGGCNAACLLTTPPCPSGKPRRPCMGTANKCIAAKFCCGKTCVPDQCCDCAAVAVGPCPPGQFVHREALKCMPCQLGYACAGGSNETATALPQPCHAGFYADVRGLTACKQCRPGTTTPAGPQGKGYTRCQPTSG